MKRKNIVKIGALLITLGIATLFGIRANSQTADGSGLSLTEITELKKGAPPSGGKYTGPKTVKALMETFDKIYDRSHSKTTVIVSRKADGESSNISILTRGETDIIADKRHVSQFTIAEIDARYPRAVWLQLLLDSRITIDSFGSYASYLSKRHTLAFLEDNPNLRNAGILGISPTDDWKTYKAAYIDKLVDTHAKIRRASELAERAKQKAEHAKELVKQTKQKAERAKELAERVKQKVERAKVQIEPIKVQLERIKTAEPASDDPKWNRMKKSRYPAL